MIFEILIGITALNLFVNLVINLIAYKKMKNLIITIRQSNVNQSNVNDVTQSMSQIEIDLNNRLRTLQTQQFGPRMSVPYVVRRKLESDE